ncbi:pseudoazurin [Roseivivax marinus]|uniref:pseudoazurin n=1 Tax=Roseivivax marinus TaxID=1379903 RepID=UPI0008B14AF4|nr:pseudoazurin [Roseivivax marinus]SEL89108.1 pseudoazurin [Roseivivax marinus]
MTVRTAMIALALSSAPAMAEIHTVEMRTRGTAGAMVYVPSRFSIAPGDSVRFVATDPGHNAATIDGMIPDGAAPFTGNIDQEIEVTLDAEGVYGIKCSPHFGMGMVMLIEVGDAEASTADLPRDLPARARARFEDWITGPE